MDFFQDGSYHEAFTIMPSIPIYFGHVNSKLIPPHINEYVKKQISQATGE